MIGMNRYGEAVGRHWERQLPGQYLAGDDPPSEGYLDKGVRLTAARRLAEQEVMADLSPAPAPDDDEDQEDDDELAANYPAADHLARLPVMDGHRCLDMRDPPRAVGDAGGP